MTSYLTQFVDVAQSMQYSQKRQAEKLDRFRTELNFAHFLRRARPELAPEWQERIIEAGRIVGEGLQGGSGNLDDLVAAGEEALQPIGLAAKEYRLLCVSHAHIDMNWMWSWPETVAVANDTFQTMLALMDEFPGFIFSQDQASTYHLIEKYNPALFDAIRQSVREGRWEVTASQWVEGEKNMASGESISRHLLYTREYFAEKFGLSPEDICVDFEPDTFGHPATLPTILARGGVKYYYHCRGSNGPHFYWWVGPDGSRLLAFNDVKWYQGNIELTVADPLIEFSLTTGLKAMPVFYGVGDHGGGPTRRDLNRIVEMNTWPIFPRVECSRLHDIFRTAEEVAHGFPEVVGERNFIFAGCYTSQARQKWANRHGENMLYSAEMAATVGERLAGVAYPQGNLEEAWRDLLFEQFHDILPGSGVRETRHYAMGRAQDVQAAAGIARSNALRALGARVNTEALRTSFLRDSERAYKDSADAARALGAGVGYATRTGGESAFSVTQTSDRAFLVFNPLPHPRHEVVEVTLWDTTLDQDQLVVTSDGAEPRPVQVLEKGNFWAHNFLTIAFPVEVPAAGYRVVCVSDRLAELGLLSDKVNDPWVTWWVSQRTIQPPDDTLENEFLKVQLSLGSGGIVSLLDKRTGREWVPGGQQTGILQYCVEQNIGMTAWVIGPFLKREDLLEGGKLKRIHNGPYVQTFRWTRMVNDTKLELDITLRQGMPRVEYRLRVDWREIGHPERGTPHLRVRFPLGVREPGPRYEIPFGSIRRELFEGQEVPALRWVDLSEADGQGATLVNSSKHGFSLEGDTLNMTLLRGSIDPDPLPDLGEHVVDYALVPHGQGWGIGDCMQEGEDMNIPLVVTSCTFHSGDLPPVLSLASVDSPNVRLAALKKSQDGCGLILRLVEVSGQESEARLTLAPELCPAGATAVEVDTLERPLASNTARLDRGALTVRAPANGVVSVRVA